MPSSFLNDTELPFCKGCGHSHIAKSAEKALQKLNLDPLEVVIVTDIGCHGIIDKSFLTHTVHGLHGRSVALGSGISAGLSDPKKKIIVFIGDGGATIGMQHLIDAAHRGFDMTVIIHNNMLYGMTGGQPSEFTAIGFKTPTLPEGASTQGYNVCELMVAAGASYIRRVIGMGDFSDELAEAIVHPGFSLVEVMELCPSYGVKANPGMKLQKIVDDAGLKIGVFKQDGTKQYSHPKRLRVDTLLNESLLVEKKYEHSLNHPLNIMLCGSAGESVQLAAEFFTKAAMMTGLHVTKKGSYPVTVGIGFSTAEIIISPQPILYTGCTNPEAMIITSEDGLQYAQPTLTRLQASTVYIDDSLVIPQTQARIVRVKFRETVGGKDAALFSMFWLLQDSKVFPVEALVDVFSSSRSSSKLNVNDFLVYQPVSFA